MPRAKRICPKPGCPETATKRYCTKHEQEYERARGNSTQRGYDSKHQRTRKTWDQKVQQGNTRCALCNKPIAPGTDWHLDHNPNGNGYRGPAHAHCNSSDGGTRGRANQP